MVARQPSGEEIDSERIGQSFAAWGRVPTVADIGVDRHAELASATLRHP